MIRLTNETTGNVLGEISDADFEIMRKALEEEGPTDQDYYINEETIQLLAEQGLSSAAQDLLRSGLDAQGELDVLWKRV